MPIPRIDTVVIGGGQAGLAAGYHLQRRGAEFVILDAGQDVGDSWRRRWDSLRLFTPACFDALPGMAFPAAGDHLPTKDEMADYLQTYATRLRLPIRHNTSVTAVTHQDDRFLVTSGDHALTTDHVIVATGANRTPRAPAFADHLDSTINQLHSSAYRNLEQIQDGPVLVVGAGNSGAEISLELAHHRHVWLAGRDVGHLPTVPGCLAYRLLQRSRVDSWYGRWIAGKRSTGGDPVVRVRPGDLSAAGVERTGAITGVRNGRPITDGGRTLNVANVIWATGYVPDLSWLRLPVLDNSGALLHERGLATRVSGLAFVGMPLQRTIVSDLVGGVGRDAAHVVGELLGT